METTSAAALLRNKARLRVGLRELDGRELGVVLSLVLASLNDRGDATLPVLLRALADRVEEAENDNTTGESS